ncbi:MAG TPA: VRR-NUC domain-containing protein [Pseudobacteroides sp.]|uniref:VRR-NUC domain-containing protein n=1 Tax=Pseudobacteroides sp. TaxID=1968840 RepID=UPI002F956D64
MSGNFKFTDKENDIEGHLRNKVKLLGGKAYKWASPGNRGVPDRIVIIPGARGGRVYFIELKAPGKEPRPQQLNKQKELKKLGVYVDTLDTKEKINRFIERVVNYEI